MPRENEYCGGSMQRGRNLVRYIVQYILHLPGQHLYLLATRRYTYLLARKYVMACELDGQSRAQVYRACPHKALLFRVFLMLQPHEYTGG